MNSNDWAVLLSAVAILISIVSIVLNIKMRRGGR